MQTNMHSISDYHLEMVVDVPASSSDPVLLSNAIATALAGASLELPPGEDLQIELTPAADTLAWDLFIGDDPSAVSTWPSTVLADETKTVIGRLMRERLYLRASADATTTCRVVLYRSRRAGLN